MRHAQGISCPRCPGAPLEERERDGVIVDVCVECRGIWLDRGELEKLLARARKEEEEFLRASDLRRERARFRDHDDDDDDDPKDRDHSGRRYEPRRHKRRSWLDAFDIFD